LLTGGSGNDKLIGTSLIDPLSGLTGNDMLLVSAAMTCSTVAQGTISCARRAG
jgi:hypothetical protein